MKQNKFKKGIVGGLLAVMLVVTAMPAPKAEAATIQELQAQIQALIAQIQALGVTVPGVGAPTNTCSTTFVSDLTIGRTGAEVTALQNFLISKGFSIPAGATGYFGTQTQSALARFQAANGIVPAVGYFGPITKSRVNAMCTVAVVQPPPVNNGGNGSGSPVTPPTLSGEADFYRFDVRSGDGTNLEEGDTNASIAEIKFEVRDGDLRVNRIDLAFTPDSANNEMDPWDTFAEVSLYDGNERIGRIDTSRRSVWRENQPTSGDYRLRFSGLSWLIEEDENVNLEVRVSIQNRVRGTDDGEVWTVFVPDDGIRALDADRASIFAGNSADGVTIGIDQAGSRDEIIVKRSNDDPLASVLQLKSNQRSGWMTVFAFDLDTDDSVNDIEVRRLPVQLTVGTSTVNTFMNDVRLVVGGETYTRKSIVNGSTNTVTFEFNRENFIINNGDRVTVEVQVDFNALAPMYEGTTIRGSVDTSGILARGVDNLSGSQIAGSAMSQIHTMRTLGVNIEPSTMSAVPQLNSASTSEDDQGVYSIEFKVTAFKSDIFIPRSTDRGTSIGSAGVNYTIEDSSLGGIAVASGTASAVLTANAGIEGSYFVVREGETKTFKLFVNYDAEYTSFYNLQLHSLNWSTSAVAPQTQQLALPSQNYETDVVYVRN